MRRPFSELLRAMEQRRREVEEGQVPVMYAPELSWRAGRRPSGCPDEEALCGWVDGKLRGQNLRRWLEVWCHVHIRRCQYCQGELKRLTAVIRPEGNGVSIEQLRPVWRGRALTCLSSSWTAAKTKLRTPYLAWASGALVVMISVSLWSVHVHDAFEGVEGPLDLRVTEDLQTLPWMEMGNPSHATDHNTAIWGD
jgi:hypothetical protein